MASTEEQEKANKVFGWYMVGQATWFSSLSLQFVLFPYLVTFVLQETPARIGLAQMSLSAPALLFLLFGGVTADRGDPRTILLRIHLIAALPPLILAAAINVDFLTFEMLLAYGLVMGTAMAFGQPARDAALSRVAGARIQRGVSVALIIQQTGQLIGMVIGGLAASLGIALLFTLQSLIMLAGGVAVRQQPKTPPDAKIVHAPRAQALTDGLAYVRRSELILPIAISTLAVGIFNIGAMLVVLPLIIRDFYNGGLLEMAVALITLRGATVLSTIAFARHGHVERQGRGFLISLALGVIAVCGLTFEIPFWLFCIFCAIWGLSAGGVMTLGRTIVQSTADKVFLARTLSIYQLGFAGGAPLGALIVGLIAGWSGSHAAMWFPTIGMALVVLWIALRSRLWSLRAPAPS